MKIPLHAKRRFVLRRLIEAGILDEDPSLFLLVAIVALSGGMMR